MPTKPEPNHSPLHHQHGGEMSFACQKLGLDPASVVDLSVNISWLGLPKVITENWDSLLPALSPYPSKNGEGIATFYEQKFGWPKGWVLPLNGSIEGIYLFSRILKLQKLLIPTPSFYDYQAAQETIGAEVVTLDLMQEDAEIEKSFRRLLPSVDGVILGTPNNPTGKIFPAELILEFATEFPNVKFLVDLAFWQYTDSTSNFLNFSELPENLYLLHSITKFYALAGIRIGAMIAQPASLNPFLVTLPPWRINSLAEKISTLLLEASDYEREVKDVVSTERENIFQKMQGHKWITLLPSDSNFFLAKLDDGINLDSFLEQALLAGFFLRDARNFAGLEGGWFRFAIHRPEVNQRWLDFLVQYQK